jgi:hypothetical protein
MSLAVVVDVLQVRSAKQGPSQPRPQSASLAPVRQRQGFCFGGVEENGGTVYRLTLAGAQLLESLLVTEGVLKKETGDKDQT